jgi:hypothetical protein
MLSGLVEAACDHRALWGEVFMKQFGLAGGQSKKVLQPSQLGKLLRRALVERFVGFF